MKKHPHHLKTTALSKEFLGKSSDYGFSLLEVLICIALLSIIALFAAQGFHQQLALHQLDHLALSFVQDAQLARQTSRQLSDKVSMRPLARHGKRSNWSEGWEIKVGEQLIKSHPNTSRVEVAEYLLKPTQQFTDMSTSLKDRHISFINGNPALLHNGGFVANRIIWQHSRYPELIRHIILGPGGRWRICNPHEDRQECH